MCVWSCFKSCPTLCDPMDSSLSVSSVHGFLQARTLEWIARPTPTQSAIQEGSNFSFLCLLHWQMCCLTPVPLGKPTNTYIHTKSRIQLRQIIMHALFFSFLPHIDHYRALGRVPCVVHQVLISCAVLGEDVYSIAQSYLPLCDPMDYNPPGSSVHAVFQARILEWVVISSSRGCFWPRDWTLNRHQTPHISWVSCIGRQIIYYPCPLGSPH